MSTGTVVRLVVDLIQKEINFTVNTLLQMAYRIESGRGLSSDGYMSRRHQSIERGLRAWVTEQTLVAVMFEIFDPQADEAYERGEVTLTYAADPIEDEQVVKLTRLRDLKGGVAEEIEVGEEYGFGHMKGKVVYTIGNWDGHQQDQHNGE
jgi:hypothetical protein